MNDTDEIPNWQKDPKLTRSLVDRVVQAHALGQRRDEYHMALYQDETRMDIHERDSITRVLNYETSVIERGENLLMEALDAARAQIAKPLRVALSAIGDADIDRACTLGATLVNGVLAANNFSQKAKALFTDGGLCRMGWIKGWFDEATSAIRLTRQLPGTVFWVEGGTEDGEEEPRTMFTQDGVPRANLIARFPKKKAQLLKCGRWEPPVVPGVDTFIPRVKDADITRAVEIWCLPEGKEEGRHQLLAGKDLDVVLIDEKYTLPRHQLVPYKWAPGLMGFGGRSLAQHIVSDHVQNNVDDKRVSVVIDGAVPVVVCTASAMQDANFAKTPYKKLIHPDGLPPPTVYSPDVSAYVGAVMERHQRRRTSAFAKAGVNQDMSAGEKPQGLSTGRAIREFKGIANERLSDALSTYDDLWIRVSRLILELAKVSYETTAAKVKAPGTNLLMEIKWSDINLTEDKYTLDVSLVPGTGIADKHEDLNDMLQAGAIDQMDVLCNLDAPDTATLRERVTAGRTRVNRAITRALRYAQPTAPSSSMDLEALVRIGQQWLDNADNKGTYKPEAVAALRVTVANARAALDQKAAPPAAEAVAPAAAEPAAEVAPGPVAVA